MYTTGEEPVEVTLRAENEMMKGLIDKFGTDMEVKVVDEEHFEAKVRVCASPTFYAWLFQWGGKVKVVGPEKVVGEYQRMVLRAL